MLGNVLKDKCNLYLKASTLGAKGETVTWSLVDSYWCKRIPLSVTAQAAYQQLNTVVTDRFIIAGTITIGLGTHKIIHNSITYEPQSTARYYKNLTDVTVRQS